MTRNHSIFSRVLILIAILVFTLWAIFLIGKYFTGYSIIDFGNLPILHEDSTGLEGNSWGDSYENLVDALYSGGNVTTVFDGQLWVPWFSSSASCLETDLKSGSSCNVGEVNFTSNCMVSDEFSQVGVMISLGKNQQRMDEFYNTLKVIKSDKGNIPSWRVYRNGSSIEACKEGINGNCDTASDTTARIIYALFAASQNVFFADESKKSEYFDYAKQMSEDFVNYEIDSNCRSSSLGHGNICYWLASGSASKSSGMDSSDYGYTGYYGDAIIAMLQACSQTKNITYCSVASNLTLNYLEASNYDGTFRTPPGRSFRWTNLNGVPEAECTYGCSPIQWDDTDAPRALGICQANYYAYLMNYTLPGLETYCKQWSDLYMSDPNSAQLSYTPDGQAAGGPQSGFFAQGLQSLLQFGAYPSKVPQTLGNALSHYSASTKTWDYAACYGVYHQAIPVRALGTALGRDIGSFDSINSWFEYTSDNSTNSSENNSTDDNSGNNESNSSNDNSDSGSSSGGGGSGGGQISEVNVPVVEDNVIDTPEEISEPENEPEVETSIDESDKSFISGRAISELTPGTGFFLIFLLGGIGVVGFFLWRHWSFHRMVNYYNDGRYIPGEGV